MNRSLFRPSSFHTRVIRVFVLLALILHGLPVQMLWAETTTRRGATAPVRATRLAATSYAAPPVFAGTTFNYTGNVQTYTVPPGVTSINIVAAGAQGGDVTGYSPFPSGGKGARMSGDFAVTPGMTLEVIVGGKGNPDPSSSGGGGGSGVNKAGTPLIVAGGGAGVDFQNPNYAGRDAVIGNSGVAGNNNSGSGGTSGNDGGDTTYVGNGNNISRGGRGWNSGNSGSFGQNGSSPNTTQTNGTFGLGGGGGSVGYGFCNCGGGGGGYSGGGSGNINQSGGGGGSFNSGTNQVNAAGSQTGNGFVMITEYAPLFTPPTLNVQAAGRPNNAGIGDPAVCLDPGGLVGIAATVTNPNNGALAATFTATLPNGLTAVAGTCTADVNPGGCTIAANGGSISWNGNLAAGQTVNIVYRARTDANAGQGSSFTINNTATVGGVPANLAYTFTLNCPNITNTRVSDQKAGSVLVFPYYTSTVGGGSDTRMTISNISNAASTAANQAYVHLFFIDGTTCAQADLFLCLTPNASFSFKASEYDPGNTGYLLAVAVDRNGVPVQNNVLIGNAFVTTPTLGDNYGAESFWANTFAVATVSGNTATLYFDQTGYDAVPKQFVAEVQSPLDAAGQQIITAGLSGNLTTSTITGAAQVGTAQAFNEKEVFASFNGWLTGTCQARATIATNSPRVPNGLGNLIRTGQSGSLKFNVGAAVGLLLTPRTATWKGIRTLHKTQTTTTSLTIPIFVPVC